MKTLSIPATTPETGASLGILELGTNSLKLHLYEEALGRFEPFRVEWDLGLEACSTLVVSNEAVAAAVSQTQKLLAEHGVRIPTRSIFGIATGAFRQAENTSILVDRLQTELGIQVWVLSDEDEASLLKDGAQNLIPSRPAMVFDLGGGSLDIVYFGKEHVWLRENLLLGVIHLHQMASRVTGAWDENEALRWIAAGLADARSFRLPEIHGTGGTVKAIAQVASVSPIPLSEIRRLEGLARKGGAQFELSERRRELFLPGLLVVRHLMEHVGAGTLHYTRIDLGEVLLGRLLPIRSALRGPLSRAFSTLLPDSVPPPEA